MELLRYVYNFCPFKTYLFTLSCGQDKKSRNLLRWDAIAVTQHMSENKRFAQNCCGRIFSQYREPLNIIPLFKDAILVLFEKIHETFRVSQNFEKCWFLLQHLTRSVHESLTSVCLRCPPFKCSQ